MFTLFKTVLHLAEQVEHEKISYWSQEDINTLSNPATSGSAANLTTARNVHIDANENATTDSTTTEPTAAKVNSFDSSSSSTSSVGKKAPTDAEIEDDPNAVVPHNTQLDGECILSSEEADMIRSLSISRKREHAEQADGSPSTATSCVSKPDFGDERVNIWKNALERRMSNSSESGTSSGKKKRKSICSVDGAHANRKSSVRNVVILDNNEEIEKNLASTRLKASVATNKTVEESMPKKSVEKMRRRHKSSTSTDSGEGGIELTFNKTSEARDGRAIEEDAIDVTSGAIAATAERNDVESPTKKLTGNNKAMSGKKHPGNREKSGRKRSGDKQKSTKKVLGGQKSHDDPEKSPVRTRHLSSSAPKCSTSPIHTVNKIPKSSRRPSLKLTTAASSPLLQSTDKPLSPVPCSDTDIPFLTDFNNSTSGASRDRQGSENRARIRTLSSDLVESNSEDLTPSEDEDYAVYGNSLGALGGWSSSFDNGVADLLAQRKQEVEREKLKEQERKQEMFEESVHAESFTRMLMELHKPTNSGADDDEVSDGLLESLPSDSSAAAKDNSGSTDGSSTSDFVCVPSQTTDKEENAKVDSFLAKIKTICKEEGLLQQNYKCAGCQRPIGMIFNKARVCGYDALYYCYECHENDEHYVPARVLYNWDFTKYKVAKTNLQLLMDHSAQPLFDVQELNPRLYEHIPEMKETQDLRTQLGYLKTYLFSCNQDVFEDFKQQIWPSDYLYESLHLYSMQDFLLIYQRQMATKLQKVVKWGIAHVLGCRLCSQQGYVCEICKDPRVIYPFQMDNMYRCPHCTAMYHMSCKETFVSCPKCARRIHYRELSMSASDDTDD